MSLAMWQARAIERSIALNIDQPTLLRSADIVTGALGLEWLNKQQLLTTRPERIISDVHPLYRDITSSSDEAIVSVCELAMYLQEFASDSAITTVLDDLRCDKYESSLLELALAHRWKKAGATLTLQPAVPAGNADFAAVIQGTRFIVEASIFPADAFSGLQHRAATIVTKTVDSVIKERLPVAVKVVIREYIDGDFEGQLRKAVRDVCTSLLRAPAGPATRSVSKNFTFGSVHVEQITASTELLTDSSGTPGPLLASDWDLCVRITTRWKPPGGFAYAVLPQAGVESQRLFMKLPRPAHEALSTRIAKKLRKEKAQLKGVSEPRIVVLDVAALSSDGLDIGAESLSTELRRIMKNTPELIGVWLLSKDFPARKRHQYVGPYVTNCDSTYELPAAFVQRLVHQELTYDFVNDTTDR